VQKTVKYENITDDKSKTLLILGDSTAVGVGVDKIEDSVPALLSDKLKVTYTENNSVSGAKVSDLKDQLQNIKLKNYDYILIQIGGNDIVAREDVDKVGKGLGDLIQILPKDAKVIVQMCGGVGVATLMPWFVRGYYTSLSLKYHTVFEKITKENGAVYINLYEDPKTDPFLKFPGIYLAKDGFHPSSSGYKLWFSKLEKVIDGELFDGVK
jgi:lysophospholipase L1-like esterase